MPAHAQSRISVEPPPRRNSVKVKAVECGGDGGSALASCLSESEHIGMLDCNIQNESDLPQSYRPSLVTLCKYRNIYIYIIIILNIEIARSAYWRVLAL